MLLSARRPAGACRTGAATLNVFACEPEWGALAQELGGDKVSSTSRPMRCRIRIRLRRAQPDRTRAHRRSGGLHRAPNSKSAGCRLLQQSGNRKIQPGQAGLFRGRGVRARCWRSRRGSIAPKATCTRAAIRTSRPIRAISCAVARRADAASVAARSGASGVLSGAPQSVRHALAARDSTLGEAGRAAQGRADRGAAQGFPYLERWLGMREVATLEPKPGVEPNSGI